MTSANPSHLLISRNPPRSPAHPQLDPALTSRHNLLTTTFTPSSPPPPRRCRRDGSSLYYQALEDDYSLHDDDWGEDDEEEEEEEEEPEIEIHPTFMEGAELPGRVKVIVGKNAFWCHKQVLWFASPFFEALLHGNWAESNPTPGRIISSGTSATTSPRATEDTTDTDQVIQHHLKIDTSDMLGQVPSISSDDSHILNAGDTGRESKDEADPVYRDLGAEDEENVRQGQEVHDGGSDGEEPPYMLREVPQQERPATQSSHGSKTARTETTQGRVRHCKRTLRASFSSSMHAEKSSRDQQGVVSGVEAVVELHDESAAAFQDFLFWAYPHLECKVSWTNVAPLFSISTKLLVSPLQKICSHFLLTHASGHPVTALALAEAYGCAELYREASRFVLDQAVWDEVEMRGLGVGTQLRLANKRSWFLERLLKLSAIDVKKEYSCRPDCPDPSRCQTQLDEKWRQAHAAVSRYGPPQPSVAFRCLRQLETFPTNPSLSMPHTMCQSAAKGWCMSLFDRMFQLNKMVTPANPGTEKYWLWITIKDSGL